MGHHVWLSTVFSFAVWLLLSHRIYLLFMLQIITIKKAACLDHFKYSTCPWCALGDLKSCTSMYLPCSSRIAIEIKNKDSSCTISAWSTRSGLPIYDTMLIMTSSWDRFKFCRRVLDELGQVPSRVDHTVALFHGEGAETVKLEQQGERCLVVVVVLETWAESRWSRQPKKKKLLKTSLYHSYPFLGSFHITLIHTLSFLPSLACSLAWMFRISQHRRFLRHDPTILAGSQPALQETHCQGRLA